MQLTGPVRKQLRQLLQACYRNYDDLQIMVAESLSVQLPDIAPLGPMPTVTFNLIEWSIAKGRVTELVQKAAADNPGNAEFQQFASSFTFAKSAEGEVERIVLEKVEFENVGKWVERLSQLRRRICRVEPQPSSESLEGFGTGFLVAPDVLLTCWHVKDKFAKPDRVVFRFDYEDDTQTGTVWKLAAADWLLAESDRHHLDYALVRLSGPAANDPVADSTRGYIKPKPLSIGPKEPILIVQHPNAQPMKLSIGTVEDPKTADNRVTYTANTLGGSSGSPSMNMALETLALHHFGSASANRGVLWNAILADLQASGKAHLLGE